MNDQIGNLGFMEFETAAIYPNVSASFAIKQVGMPKLTYRREYVVSAISGSGFGRGTGTQVKWRILEISYFVSLKGHSLLFDIMLSGKWLLAISIDRMANSLRSA